MPSLTSFQDTWILAGVRRNPRRQALRDPELLLERIKAFSHGSTTQIFNAAPVISLKQIHVAAVSASLAFKAGVNIAKKLEIEFLLRLAADTQINRVLGRLGVDSGTGEVGVCIISESRDSALDVYGKVASLLGGEEVDEKYLSGHERVSKALKFYGIEGDLDVVQAGSREEAALLLILEKMAVLDVER